MHLVGDRRVAPNPLPRAWAVLAQITARTSALFRLHRWPDSSAFRPLHSLTHSASPIRQDALAHSDGRKLPRPTQTAVHPKMTTEAAMLRISAKHRNMAARLRPAKTAAIWARCFACRPGHRHSRETDQLFVASPIFRCIAFRSRSLHSQNRPASLRKPNWSETSSSGCDPAFEPTLTPFGVARSDLRSAVEDSE